MFCNIDGTENTLGRGVPMMMLDWILATLRPVAVLPEASTVIPVDRSALADFVRILHELDIEEEEDEG